jgi:hypothetical protein
MIITVMRAVARCRMIMLVFVNMNVFVKFSMYGHMKPCTMNMRICTTTTKPTAKNDQNLFLMYLCRFDCHPSTNEQVSRPRAMMRQ